MRKRFIAILIMFLLNQIVLGQITFAEELLQDEAAKMDFNMAVKFALKNNNNIRGLRHNLSSTEREIGIARSDMMPKIAFVEDFTATNNPTDAFALRINQARAVAGDLTLDALNHPAGVTNFLTSGAIKQPIFDRKAMIEIKMAKKEYSANGYMFIRKQEELINQVAQAYLSVSTAQELIKVSELAIKDAKTHLQIAELRYKSNSGLYSDTLRAKTAIEEAEQDLVSAERNLKVTKRKLGLLLGLETAVEISNNLPEIKLQDINYYKDFSVYRNDIKANEILVENEKNNIKSAQSDWFPTLNAYASYNLYNNNFPFGSEGQNYIAGAIFKWMVFDGNKRKYEILKAKDKEAEEKEYLEGFKKNVRFRVFEIYSNVEEHKKNLELAISSLKAAEENTKIVEKRWQNKLSPFIDLTDAQAHLDFARANVVTCKNDLTEDLINLTFESGIIVQELQLE